MITRTETRTGRRHAPVIRPNDVVSGPEQTILNGLNEIDRAISAKWALLGGTPGAPLQQGPNGLRRIGEGYYREYQKGRIYFRHDHPPFHVYGAIGQRYIEMGGPNSWIGWPTSDEQNFTEGGRVSTFENGAIYWWPDTGAIEMKDVAVIYKGLYCFGETDNDGQSASDEPYVYLGVVPVPTTTGTTTRSMIYEDIDAGEAQTDSIEIYRGLPYGLAMTAVLMEHDYGDPNTYRDAIQKGVDKAAEGVKSAVGYIPVVGPYLGPACEWLLKEIGPAIVEWINDLIGTADDHVGTVAFSITARELVTAVGMSRKNFGGILYHTESPLISGDGASYKVYFEIVDASA